MKLYFQIQNYDWSPERYKYSVEQMMLMLFPGERPEYPETYSQDKNQAVFTLNRGPERTEVTVRVETRTGQDGVPVPWAADLTGRRSPALEACIAEDLGIPAERQVWHEREAEN